MLSVVVHASRCVPLLLYFMLYGVDSTQPRWSAVGTTTAASGHCLRSTLTRQGNSVRLPPATPALLALASSSRSQRAWSPTTTVTLMAGSGTSRGHVPVMRRPGSGGAALSHDLPLFRPDICQVGTDRASVMRCRRSLLVAVGRCCCCHPRDTSSPLATFPARLWSLRAAASHPSD